MKQITITCDGEAKKLYTENVKSAEAIIMLYEALEAVCYNREQPIEQALTIAYSMQDKGELFNELEEE